MAARSTHDSLAEYDRKRDFARTPEPSGRTLPHAPKRRRGRLRFVVQKHRASHLHYDFRLEADGVLKSWAIPKGPTLDPAERRLAMQTEDHPYEYRDFEGVIPEGNYGAGEVIVWDRGTYSPIDGVSAAESIDHGKIKFVLHGKKLNGTFTLVRMRGRSPDDRAWLLIKDKDDAAERGWRDADHDGSVKSGRTLDDVAHARHAKRWESNRPAATRRVAPRHRPLPNFGAADVTLATLTDEPFQDEDWYFEIKWDGIRALCVVDDERRVRLVSRRGLDQLAKFPELAGLGDAFAPVPIVVDGEIVSLDSEG